MQFTSNSFLLFLKGPASMMRSHFSIFLTTCLLFTGAGLLAQTSSITGEITSADGKAAEMVNVVLKGSPYGTVTNSKGAYTISAVPFGQYTITAFLMGFSAQEQLVNVDGSVLAPINFVMAQNSKELEEVVISIARTPFVSNDVSSSLRLETPVLELPQNVQVVTEAALKNQQAMSLSDGVVRNMSGAVRLEHWADLYTNISMRGSQIQAFRNGFNVVNSAWGPLTEDMSFVDRIEVVKGPAGFMLASGDPSGLYNVVTKQPSGKDKGEASVTLGSFNFYRSTLDLDGHLSKDKRLLFRLNLAAQNKGSHRVNEFNNRYVLAPVLSYRLDENTTLTAEYNLQRANMSDVGSYYLFATEGMGHRPVGLSSLPSGMPATAITDQNVYVNLKHRINSNWKVTAQLSRFWYNQQGTSMWPSSVDSLGNIMRASSSWDAKSSMNLGQVFVNGKISTGPLRHKILSGIDMGQKSYWADWGQYHVLDSAGAEFNTFEPNYGVPVNGYPEFDYSTSIEQRAQKGGGTLSQRYTAAYAQDEIAVLENRLRLTLAARYTYVTQSEYGAAAKTATRVTPRLGLSGSLDKHTAVYAVYDQAFTPQNGKLANGGDVQPLTGTNTEFGVKRDWFKGRWNTTISVYQIVKRNELTADPNSAPSAGLSVVLGEKTAKGFEFDLKGKIAKGLNVIANYAYTDSRVTKVTEGVAGIEVGDAVPGYATHVANAWLSYEFQQKSLKGFGLNFGATFLGKRNTYWDALPAGAQGLPDYLKLDAGISYEHQNFSARINIYNLLNDYLYSGSYYAWLNAYYWQTEAPRNARLTIAYKF